MTYQPVQQKLRPEGADHEQKTQKMCQNRCIYKDVLVRVRRIIQRLFRLGGGRISLMAGRAADLNVSNEGAFTADAGS